MWPKFSAFVSIVHLLPWMPLMLKISTALLPKSCVFTCILALRETQNECVTQNESGIFFGGGDLHSNIPIVITSHNSCGTECIYGPSDRVWCWLGSSLFTQLAALLLRTVKDNIVIAKDVHLSYRQLIGSATFQVDKEERATCCILLFFTCADTPLDILTSRGKIPERAINPAALHVLISALLEVGAL